MKFTRIGIEIGPIEIFGLTLNPTLHFYGLLIVIGILVAAGLAAWLAKRDGKDPEQIWNGLLWAVFGGIIGARLWFVFFPPQASIDAGRDTGWMLLHPFDLNDGPLAIWNGGLGIFGALIGGGIGVYMFAKRAKLKNLWSWIDIAVIAFPLGHAIGRWGNFVNQELYGRPTSLPWAIQVDNPPLEYRDAEGFHPLFLYESLWNIALCAFLVWVWLRYRARFKPGDFLLMYLIGYGVVRFLLEFLRLETGVIPIIGGNSSQVFTFITVVLATLLLAYRHREDRLRAPQYHEDGRPVGKSKKPTSKKKSNA